MIINLNVIHTSTLLLSAHLLATSRCSSNDVDDLEQHCSVEDGDCSKSVKTSRHKYDETANEKWIKFLEEHEKALEKYATSSEKELSDKFPYASVIDQDLKPFKKTGIR